MEQRDISIQQKILNNERARSSEVAVEVEVEAEEEVEEEV